MDAIYLRMMMEVSLDYLKFAKNVFPETIFKKDVALKHSYRTKIALKCPFPSYIHFFVVCIKNLPGLPKRLHANASDIFEKGFEIKETVLNPAKGWA